MSMRPRLLLAMAATLAPAAIALSLGQRLSVRPTSGPLAFENLLVDVAEVVAFGAAAWLCVATALAVVAEVRGAGSLAARLSQRITPRCVAAVIGLVVGGAAGLAPITASAADDATTTRPDISGLQLPDRPSVAARSLPARKPVDGRSVVIVRSGDSLWRVAAERLPPGADDAAVARACKRWYAANRAAIGPDPDLLLPGTRLEPPTDDRERKP
ncbi:hypothetical protein MU582_05900 [Nocardioidaceae bacterium SCSIO 66511]|nr:hypothetical protein MU582_05900 [Nocardioidaceae bacterium SCSIO 66511]